MKRQKNLAYTLVETAIVITIVGVLMALAATAYSIWQKNVIAATTTNNIDAVMDAVAEFLVQNGRYPCPAPLDAARTAPGYGLETDCTSAIVGAGAFGSGYYVEDTGGLRVRRGAVPFRMLNLPEPLSKDGYRNRLQYAVTESLAVSVPPTPVGGIRVNDGAGNALTSTLHFLVFSSGEDRAGAFTYDGKQPLLCGTMELDAENCNTLTSSAPTYRFAQQGNALGAGHFDDTVKLSSSAPAPLWMATDDIGNDIHDTGLADVIGVGSMPSTATVRLDVNGNMRASEKVHMDQICDSTGGACFPTIKITGTQPEMKCPKSSDPPTAIYAYKIINGQVECRNTIAFTCPAGQVMTGIGAGGFPICS